jgi:hypothetical protein
MESMLFLLLTNHVISSALQALHKSILLKIRHSEALANKRALTIKLTKNVFMNSTKIGPESETSMKTICLYGFLTALQPYQVTSITLGGHESKKFRVAAKL